MCRNISVRQGQGFAGVHSSRATPAQFRVPCCKCAIHKKFLTIGWEFSRDPTSTLRQFGIVIRNTLWNYFRTGKNCGRVSRQIRDNGCTIAQRERFWSHAQMTQAWSPYQTYEWRLREKSIGQISYESMCDRNICCDIFVDIWRSEGGGVQQACGDSYTKWIPQTVLSGALGIQMTSFSKDRFVSFVATGVKTSTPRANFYSNGLHWCHINNNFALMVNK